MSAVETDAVNLVMQAAAHGVHVSLSRKDNA